MSKSTWAIGAACLLTFLAAVQASACGESLFRAGFGLNIPAGKVDRPAAIVIFAPSNKDVFFDDAKVASRLDKSGHKVTVVHSAAVPEAAGEDPAFDVVLARDGDFENAKVAMGPRVANSVFVPVHEGFTKTGDNLSLSANAPLRQILTVLKVAMETESSAQPTT